MNQIITSILDSDLYKFSMQQAVFHQYPKAFGRYQFVCRNDGVEFTKEMVDEIKRQIDLMRNVTLTQDEKKYMHRLDFFRNDYLDWLENYRFDPIEVHVYKGHDKKLNINVVGPWVTTILWEVPVLSIVNEVYFQYKYGFSPELAAEGQRRLNVKIEKINEVNAETGNNLIIAEFGTRRRYSKMWQYKVVSDLVAAKAIVGTSNVYLAMKHGIKAIGTQAHEWICGHLALVDNISQAQSRALHVWLQEYDNKLGIALTDSFTSDAFFRDFGYALSNGFDGVRHDSGDAFEFGEKVIEHYKQLAIRPLSKTIVFSDGLNVDKAIRLNDYFGGMIKTSFGIGTNLTNDLGPEPLNIVMKLVALARSEEENDTPIIKLSDVSTKNIGDKVMIREVKQAYGVEEEVVV